MILVNARHAKAVAGRKTDFTDAAWLVPAGRVRAPADLIRAAGADPPPARTHPAADSAVDGAAPDRPAAGEALEDASIKLSRVATDIMGVSGRAMLGALIEGDATPRCWP